MAIVEFRGISKHFGGVAALRGVDLEILRGECHALVGENGAGKSTLGRILAGIHRPDAGSVRLDGVAVRFREPRDAARCGIGMVHQELAFCPELSVAENLCLGRYPRTRGLLARRAMHETARRQLEHVGLFVDVRRPMRSLSTAQEQLVQIATAIAAGARILILDEPTSSLTERETQGLFALLDQLKARGVTQVYVSHRMPEVFRLADRISVLRDGVRVATTRRDATSPDELVRWMSGRELTTAPAAARSIGGLLLEVEELRAPGKFDVRRLAVHAGEIVGLAGLVGAGRSELAAAIFGLDSAARGRLRVAGREVRLGSPRVAMRAALALVPEDRKRQGLAPLLSGCANLSLTLLDRLRRLLWLDRAAERRVAQEYFAGLSIRADSIDAPVWQLSGGNQQKVVLAKWLARSPRVLIVDEPTRGVDVGAKAGIHALLADLAARGVGILLISSELPELLALSDRIAVMREGRIVGELPRADATPERVLRLMSGVEGATR